MKYWYIILFAFLSVVQSTKAMQPRHIVRVYQEGCEQCCCIGCLTLGMGLISYVAVLYAPDLSPHTEDRNVSILSVYPTIERKIQ